LGECSYTWTPLALTTGRRLVYATALILRLIQACPEAVSVRTHSGFKTKTPFHIACEADSDYQVLKVMLSINPKLATEPFVKTDVYSVTENPLQLLWKHKNHPVETNAKMALLLKAAHYGTVRTLPEGRPFRILNATCSVRCPRDYFSQILHENITQVAQADENGLYPLHYAVKNALADSQSYTQFVVECLLDACPKAASIPDKEGRLPLHVAVLDTLMTWHKGGVRELTYSYPNALRKADPSSGLVPFLASAEAATKSRLHLSTTYELLLAAPEMVQAWRTGE